MAANLSLYRGVTYPSVYQHTDGSGNKLPLTGCSVFFTVKAAKYDDDPTDATAVFKANATITDAVNGLAGWNTLIPAVGVLPGKYHYDITVKDATGIELPPVIIGIATILGKSTNRTS